MNKLGKDLGEKSLTAVQTEYGTVLKSQKRLQVNIGFVNTVG